MPRANHSNKPYSRLTRRAVAGVSFDGKQFHGGDADRFNDVLELAVEDAIHYGVLRIMDDIGQNSGDISGMIFSGGDEVGAITGTLGSYMMAEIRSAKEDLGA